MGVLRLRRVPAYGYIFTALAAYLLGSLPTGYLVARARGVDIRTVGSGNIGATNAFRVLGRGWGGCVLVIDFLKGLGACLAVPFLIRVLFQLQAVDADTVAPGLVAAVCAVLGHNFPLWLGFRGGKGIATSAGALTALVPWALLIGLAVWVILFVLTRYVSVGSIAAAAVLPVATWFTSGGDRALTLITSLLGAMAILKHRSNILRLMAGTESQISFCKQPKGPRP
ncbi:MAG: glycerol-3-phosphate 1-O-acyltransferase PlsY [Verrucomicrobia bacterium]|nr:glycerol-3-phosphate 1-O-acyltransferase PlsY [Verrucomicrobiota bacterium]